MLIGGLLFARCLIGNEHQEEESRLVSTYPKPGVAEPHEHHCNCHYRRPSDHSYSWQVFTLFNLEDHLTLAADLHPLQRLISTFLPKPCYRLTSPSEVDHNSLIPNLAIDSHHPLRPFTAFSYKPCCSFVCSLASAQSILSQAQDQFTSTVANKMPPQTPKRHRTKESFKRFVGRPPGLKGYH